MRLGYIKDENGNFVRKFIKDGEDDSEVLYHVVAEFGEFAWVDEGHIQEAKDILLERMIESIRELAKRDDFWIVKRPSDFENSETESFGLFQIPPEAKEGKCTVGLKFHLPQMEGYYKRDKADEMQNQLDACMKHLNI